MYLLRISRSTRKDAINPFLSSIFYINVSFFVAFEILARTPVSRSRAGEDGIQGLQCNTDVLSRLKTRTLEWWPAPQPESGLDSMLVMFNVNKHGGRQATGPAS